MPITSAHYSNQLPAVCRVLADRVLSAIVLYVQNSGAPQRAMEDALENTFRLLEMYRSNTFMFDNPSGVLGADPRMTAGIPSYSYKSSVEPITLVQEKLTQAIQDAFGTGVNREEVVEDLEQVLGAVAGYGKASDEKVLKARDFFSRLKEGLASNPSEAAA